MSKKSRSKAKVATQSRTRRSRVRFRIWFPLVVGFAAVIGVALIVCRVPNPPAVPLTNLDPVVAALIESCRREVKASPRSGTAWGHLGTVLLHAEFVPQSDFAFVQAERLSPDEPRWPYLDGILLKESRPDAAVARFARAARLAGNEADGPRLRLARLLFERGRLEEAGAQFQNLLKEQADHGPALLGLARIRVAQGRPAESAELLSRCLQDPHVAQSARALSAQVERQLGHPVNADVAPTSKPPPSDVAWPDPYWTEALQYRVGRLAEIERTQALIDAGRLDEALKVLNRVAIDYPNDGDSRYLTGWVLNRRGRGGEAERSLREHLRLSPQSPKGLAQLAVALLAQERYADAIEVLHSALRVKPTWAELHFNLAYACAQLGRTDEAIGHFRDALRQDPNYVEGYIALADLLSRKDQRAEAVELVRRALILDPSDERVKVLQQRLGEGR